MESNELEELTRTVARLRVELVHELESVGRDATIPTLGTGPMRLSWLEESPDVVDTAMPSVTVEDDDDVPDMDDQADSEAGDFVDELELSDDEDWEDAEDEEEDIMDRDSIDILNDEKIGFLQRSKYWLHKQMEKGKTTLAKPAAMSTIERETRDMIIKEMTEEYIKYDLVPEDWEATLSELWVKDWGAVKELWMWNKIQDYGTDPKPIARRAFKNVPGAILRKNTVYMWFTSTGSPAVRKLIRESDTGRTPWKKALRRFDPALEGGAEVIHGGYGGQSDKSAKGRYVSCKRDAETGKTPIKARVLSIAFLAMRHQQRPRPTDVDLQMVVGQLKNSDRQDALEALVIKMVGGLNLKIGGKTFRRLPIAPWKDELVDVPLGVFKRIWVIGDMPPTTQHLDKGDKRLHLLLKRHYRRAGAPIYDDDLVLGDVWHADDFAKDNRPVGRVLGNQGPQGTNRTLWNKLPRASVTKHHPNIGRDFVRSFFEDEVAITMQVMSLTTLGAVFKELLDFDPEVEEEGMFELWIAANWGDFWYFQMPDGKVKIVALMPHPCRNLSHGATEEEHWAWDDVLTGSMVPPALATWAEWHRVAKKQRKEARIARLAAEAEEIDEAA